LHAVHKLTDYATQEWIMDKKPADENTKKLIFVVVYYSVFVVTLLGLGPLFVYLFLDY
jgi:hypothetical protein